MSPEDAREVIISFVRDYKKYPELWAKAGITTRSDLVGFLRQLAKGHGVTDTLIDEIQEELTSILNAKPL